MGDKIMKISVDALQFYSSNLTKLPGHDHVSAVFRDCISITTAHLSSNVNQSVGVGDTKRSPSTALFECGVLRDLLWERLNIGHWKDVPEVYRVMYRVTRLMEAILTMTSCGDTKATPSDVTMATTSCDTMATPSRDTMTTPSCGTLTTPSCVTMATPSCDTMATPSCVTMATPSCVTKAALLHCDMALIMGAPLQSEHFTQELADLLQKELSRHNTRHLIAEIPPTPNPIPSFQNLNNVVTVPIHDQPSMECFVQLVQAGKPFVMRGVIDHWIALSKWTPQYFVDNFGDRTVPVEVGSSYTSSNWTQKLMTMEKFMKEHVFSADNTVGYLAQFDLFHHIPSLRNDITPLDYISLFSENSVDQCWFGPAGTVSPLHHDRYHNLFCQIHGHKRFIMFDRVEAMSAHESVLLSNTSQLDVESDFIKEQAWYVEPVMSREVCDVKWKWGVTVASKSNVAPTDTFVQMDLGLKDENGNTESVAMEMSLDQYYELLIELEKAKLALQNQN
eukprot:sb/3464026/